MPAIYAVSEDASITDTAAQSEITQNGDLPAIPPAYTLLFAES